MRVEIDVALRSWNPGAADPETQSVPFNPRELHDDIVGELRKIAGKHGWRVSRGTPERGGAFRGTGWFKKPTYTTRISIKAHEGSAAKQT